MADTNQETALSLGLLLNGERVLRISPLSVNEENQEDTEGAPLASTITQDSSASPHSSNPTQSFYHRNNPTNHNQSSLSNPTLKITSINIEGISSAKEEILADLCRNTLSSLLFKRPTEDLKIIDQRLTVCH